MGLYIQLRLEKEHQEKFNVRLMKGAVHQHQKLDRPHRCTVCDGTGSYLESADAHRSEGWVPCRHCVNGTVTHKSVMVQKPVYRVRSRP